MPKSCFRTVILSVLFTFCQIALAEDAYRGFASYQEINKDIYIGTIELPRKPISYVHIHSMPGIKVMRFDILKENYPIRSFTRHLGSWGVKGNEDTRFTKRLEKQDINTVYQLQGLIKKQLGRAYFKKGDNLTVTLDGGKINIQVNRMQVFDTRNKALGSYFLNMWLGNPPADQAFYDQLIPPNAIKRDKILAKLATVADDFDINNQRFLKAGEAKAAPESTRPNTKTLADKKAIEAQTKKAEAARKAKVAAEQKHKKQAAEQAELMKQLEAQRAAQKKLEAELAAQRAQNEKLAKQQAADRAARQKAEQAALEKQMAAEEAALKAAQAEEARLIAEQEALLTQQLAEQKAAEERAKSEVFAARAQAKQPPESKAEAGTQTTPAQKERIIPQKITVSRSNHTTKVLSLEEALANNAQRLVTALTMSPVPIDYTQFDEVVIWVSETGEVLSAQASLRHGKIGRKEASVINKMAKNISPVDITQAMTAPGIYQMTLNVK